MHTPELQPQSVCCRGLSHNDPEQQSETSLKTMELQWQSYVDNLKSVGSFSNALGICDVSGSMDGLPMEVLLLPLLFVTFTMQLLFVLKPCYYCKNTQETFPFGSGLR